MGFKTHEADNVETISSFCTESLNLKPQILFQLNCTQAEHIFIGLISSYI